VIDFGQLQRATTRQVGWHDKEPAMSMSQGLFSFSSAFRTVSLITIAALVLTTSETPVVAAPVSTRDISTPVASSGATDFGAARRHRHARRGEAAGAAFVAMTFGMIAGAIAAQQRREYYDNYGYYYGPRYYYGSGYYYGAPHYYVRRYYYPPY
jgi:hypothetical protein